MKYAQLNGRGDIVAFYDDAVVAPEQIGSATLITDAQWAACVDRPDDWPALAKTLLAVAPATAEQLLARDAQALERWRQQATVSRFQARAALHLAGLLPQVEVLMAAPEADMLARLAWQDALEFRRSSPTVLALAQKLGLGELQLDQLFTTAAEIQA